MKTIVVEIGYMFVVALSAYGQGTFTFINKGAPTRVGSIDGPIAGSNIWGQMFAGAMPESLAPVERSMPHIKNGLVFGGIVTVPDVPPFTTAYVQMAAWDSTLWGTSLASVPDEWMGRTDIVPVMLVDSVAAPFTPIFTRSAIVPVPEPAFSCRRGMRLHGSFMRRKRPLFLALQALSTLVS